MQPEQVILGNRSLGVGLALVVGKFDLEYVRPEYLDHRANLAAAQNQIGQIGGEGDHIKQLNWVRLWRPTARNK